MNIQLYVLTSLTCNVKRFVFFNEKFADDISFLKETLFKFSVKNYQSYINRLDNPDISEESL